MVLETDQFSKSFFDPSGEQEKAKKGVLPSVSFICHRRTKVKTAAVA